MRVVHLAVRLGRETAELLAGALPDTFRLMTPMEEVGARKILHGLELAILAEGVAHEAKLAEDRAEEMKAIPATTVKEEARNTYTQSLEGRSK